MPTKKSYVTVTDQLIARILARVDKNGPLPAAPNSSVEGGCWLWTGGRFPAGYGSISVGNENKLVHQLVYIGLVGEIPEGCEIDHKCRVRHCCNPQHLEAVPRIINVLRSRRPFCKNGHPYDAANTSYVKGNPNQRVCKACSREKTKAYRARRKLSHAA